MAFPTLRGICLLSAAASIGMWVRSYFVADHYIWRVQQDAAAGFRWVESRSLATVPGRLIFQERTAVM